MAEIFSFLKLLPALVQLCIEAQKFISSQLGENPEQKLAAMTDGFKALRESKTTEDRVDALKRIHGIIDKF